MGREGIEEKLGGFFDKKVIESKQHPFIAFYNRYTDYIIVAYSVLGGVSLLTFIALASALFYYSRKERGLYSFLEIGLTLFILLLLAFCLLPGQM